MRKTVEPKPNPIPQPKPEPTPKPKPKPNPNPNPHLGVLQLVEQNIRRLNVAVQHRVAVQVGDPLRDLVREPPGWG